MRRFVLILVLAGVLAVALPVSAMARAPKAPVVTDLVYGRRAVDVGEVKVWNDRDFLYVKYIVTKPGWYLLESHLEIKPSVSRIPQRNGNAVPRRFTFKQEHDWVTEYEYKIPLTRPAGAELAIAAHGVVGQKGGGVAGVCGSLPTTATEQLVYTGIWYDVLVTGGTSLDGTYLAWSANPLIDIYTSYEYPATVVCSYDSGTLPAGLIDKPQNLDLVNWILNQDYPSQGYSLYSVQVAIWHLLQDEPQTLDADSATIVADAEAEGDGFTPGSGQSVAIILLPWWDGYGWTMPTIIMKPVEDCATVEESVWARGKGFWGRNRSMYFHYVVQ